MTATVPAHRAAEGTSDSAALPFLDDRHVEQAEALQLWCARNGDLWSDPLEPVEDRCTAIVRRLGTGGWLRFLTAGHDGRDGRWDFRSICLAREILAHSEDLADLAFSIQALAAMPLARHGSTTQRERHLEDLAAGRAVGSFAVSELAAGSDLGSLGLAARRTPRGWVLEGEKAWIANGSTADLHTVIARTGDGPAALGLSAFLVPASTPGLSVEPVSLIAPRPFAHLRFQECLLPDESLLGRPGQGFAIAMEVLEHFRMTVGAAAVGLARRAAEAALAHTRDRRIGPKSLFEFDTAKAALADMATGLSASWLLVLRAAWEVDRGNRRFAKHSSMAKLHATESAQQTVDAAVALFGAAGVVSGSVPEQLYRQVRLLRIYEGTSEVQRATIAGTLDFAALTAARPAGGAR